MRKGYPCRKIDEIDKDKALEEVADCLAFLLKLLNRFKHDFSNEFKLNPYMISDFGKHDYKSGAWLATVKCLSTPSLIDGIEVCGLLRGVL